MLAQGTRYWVFAALVAAGLLVAPQIALVSLAAQGTFEVWERLWQTSLLTYLFDTAVLCCMTLVVAFCFGAPSAWIISQYAFRGRSLLSWLLVLPLAVPGYIAAYTYTELLGDAGLLQTSLSELFANPALSDFRLFEIRSKFGAALVLGSVLYPYVYLTARAAFFQNSGHIYDVARSLQASSRRVFFRIAIPLARPALAAGLGLVCMEVLNDIGTVEYFGIQTLSFGVYVEWLNHDSPSGAASLAVLLLVIVLVMFGVEYMARGRRKYHLSHTGVKSSASLPLRGRAELGALLLCGIPVFLGLVVPLSVLLNGAGNAVSSADVGFIDTLLDAVWNSVRIAAITVISLICIAMLIAYAVRIAQGRVMFVLARFASIGYAVPGVVLALGLLIALRSVEEFFFYTVGIEGLWLSGSIFALVFGYCARFMAVAYGTLESGYAQIPYSTDLAARTMGGTLGGILAKIHLPMLRPSLIAAAMLVMVDSIKELPITLLLRPFGFDNLATATYTNASIGIFDHAAVTALIIVLVGLIPVLVLDAIMRRAGMTGKRNSL